MEDRRRSEVVCSDRVAFIGTEIIRLWNKQNWTAGELYITLRELQRMIEENTGVEIKSYHEAMPSMEN